MLKDRIKNIDYYLLVLVVIIVIISFVVLSSSTYEDGINKDYIKKQLTISLIGFIGLVFFALVDYKFIGLLWKLIYVVNILLLLLVRYIGSTNNMGSQRWINIGTFGLQPSELAKLAIIITLAKFLSDREGRVNSPKNLLLTLVHVSIPFYLVLKQPDLGTSIVFVVITFMMLFVAGLNWKIIIATLIGATLSLPIVWQFMQDYQRDRILSFLDPTLDPLGSGYHVLQSKIAIGSGGVSGKGIYNGLFTKLKFVPERHTDFVFAVIGEEFGMVGAYTILIILLLIMIKCCIIAIKCEDLHGKLIVSGVVGMFLFQTFENVGMTMGIMPVTGIPLPFISYGGTSLMVSLMLIGIVLNISSQKSKKLRFY